MNRNQIHFAEGLPGEDGVISGMRSSAQVLVYLNLELAKEAGLPLFRSQNNVLLSPGFDGVVPPFLFEQVLERSSGRVLFKGDPTLLHEWRQSRAAGAAGAPAGAVAATGRG
jgi:2'-phosphotransferase